MQQVDLYIARRALLVMLGLSCVTILGSLGYMLIEGWSFSDSLYMTTITISTVGFGEVRPLHPHSRVCRDRGRRPPSGARRRRQCDRSLPHGGSRVAASIMQPGVVDFLELVGLEGDHSIGIEEVAISSDSPFVGETVMGMEDATVGIRLVGIQSEGGRWWPCRGPTARFCPAT